MSGSNPDLSKLDAGGYYDDAVHLRDSARPERTLCDQDAAPRNIARPWEFREDGAECWTCALRREQQRVGRLA